MLPSHGVHMFNSTQSAFCRQSSMNAWIRGSSRVRPAVEKGVASAGCRLYSVQRYPAL